LLNEELIQSNNSKYSLDETLCDELNDENSNFEIVSFLIANGANPNYF
jgi:hypothetical protein